VPTCSGIRKAVQMYAIHHYLLTREVKIVQALLNNTREEILRVRPHANLKAQEETWPVGSPTPHHPTSRYFKE